MNTDIKILLVNDSNTHKTEIQSMLELGEYSVDIGSDLKKVLVYLKSGKPDLIIAHSSMSHTNKLNLCKHALESFPDIPVVALLFHSDEKQLEELLDSGVKDCIFKPFSRTKLFFRIASVLKQNKIEKKLTDIISKLRTKQLKIENHNKELQIIKKESKQIDYSFKQIFYNASDALLLIDHNSFIDCNEATVKLLNAGSKETVLITHPSELSPKKQADGRDSFEKANEMIKIAYKNGFHRFEWLHKKITGEVFPVEVSHTLIEYNNKIMLHTLWKDLTDTRIKEKQLKVQSSRLSKAQEIAHVGSWEVDLITNKIELTDEYYRLFELPIGSDVTIEQILDRIHPEDRKEVELQRKNLVLGKPYKLQYRIVIDNSIKFVISNAEVVYGDDNKPIKLIGTAIDVTENITFENKLIESEKRFRGAFENSSTGLSITSLKGKFIKVNTFLCNMLGYSEEEILGKTFLEITHPDDLKVDLEYTQQLLKGEIPYYQLGKRYFHKHGSILWVILSVSLVKDQKGIPLYFVSQVENVTLRKKAQRELLLSNEQLQKLSAKLQNNLIGTVIALANTVEYRDQYTVGHSRNVADLACAIGKRMGLSTKKIEALNMAGLLHDIGKIGVPFEVLGKLEALTEDEYEIIKTHPQVGYDLVKPIDFLLPVAQIILEHHERLDGSGYPSGKTTEKLLIESKIMAVADVVESMALARPYRLALGERIALDEIKEGKGTLYDNEVADACIILFQKKGFEFNKS